jgi:hypothetical protein
VPERTAFLLFQGELARGAEGRPALGNDEIRAGMVAFAEGYAAAAARPGMAGMATADLNYCMAVAGALERVRR